MKSISAGIILRIYTTMLGKKKSLVLLKDYLINTKKIDNISDAQFCQGHTMRWGLAWSFSQQKLNQFNYVI
jgi:methyltransferase